MTKTLKKQLNNLTLEQLFIIAQDLDSSFWAYKDLKDFVVDKIQDDDVFIALHILNTLNDELAEYYNYDASMGILDTVAPITTKEEFINYLEDYNDEDIKKVLKKYQGGF
ncbi:MAG: hypothetical protein SO148_05085 [Candidatus Onthovivens sp.]|nr:hypothetical protein [Candidatus Onthovivens sp.]